MFKRISYTGLILFLMFWSIDSNVSAFELKEGKYKITTSVEMPGMPQGTIPPQTFVHCLTNQEPIPGSNTPSSDCEIKNVRQDGNTYTWEMECVQDGQKMTSKGSITYSGEGFEGSSTVTMGPQAGNMTIVTKMSGKRISKCDDAP